VRIALIDGPVYGPILQTADDVCAALASFSGKTDPAVIACVSRHVELAERMHQPGRFNGPAIMLRCPLPLYEHFWVQVQGGLEVRPILSRGNEHASSIIYYVSPLSSSYRIRRQDFPPELDTIGNWFGSVFDRKQITKGEMSLFSPPEHYVEIYADEFFCMRVHHWTTNTDNLIISLPTQHGSQKVELQPPMFRRPKVHTADVASRLFFQLCCTQFQYPQLAHPWIRRTFLPVANRALCYIYFSSTYWSHFKVQYELAQPCILFLTYYDRCGHVVHGERIDDASASTWIRVLDFGGVVLGRLVPQTLTDLMHLSHNGKLLLRDRFQQHSEARLSTLNNLGHDNSSAISLNVAGYSTMLSRKILLIRALRAHAQENARFDDFRLIDTLKTIKSLVVLDVQGTHHFNITLRSNADLIVALLSQFMNSD